MPRLKQPNLLEKIALEALFDYVLLFCERLSAESSLETFRHGISIIKRDICTRIPWFLRAEFTHRFLEKFCNNQHRESHIQAALEIVMDVEIPGLRFTRKIVSLLKLDDRHRLKKLKELDMSDDFVYKENMFQNFDLQELTTLIPTSGCTDSDLHFIGQNCPKLEDLKIHNYRSITDQGLTALSLCTELRVVHLVGGGISNVPINRFFSTHTKLEEFRYEIDAYWMGDILSHLDSLSVYPSMKRFICEKYDQITNAHLRNIVTKFPNLTYLELIGAIPEDLSTLKTLNSLKGLKCGFIEATTIDGVRTSWGSIKEVLTFVGSNITSLDFSCCNLGFFWYQAEINFIFNHCPNLEYLKFDHGDGHILIPAFPKLKTLDPHIEIQFESIELLDDPTIEFEKLSELETLILDNYDVNFEFMKSIILDNDRFPKLSVVETIFMKPEDLTKLEHLAKTNNLDVTIKNNPEPTWYIEYRLGLNDD